MIGNRILTQNDREKLANFLFKCLDYGVSKERIKDLAQIWLEQDGKVSNEDLAAISRKYKDEILGTDMAHFLIICTLPVAILCGPMVSLEKTTEGVIMMGTLAGLTALVSIASMGYLVNKHVGNKKYASACAEEMIDAHNVKCYKELESDVQNSHNLINELLDNQTNPYLSLTLNNTQSGLYAPSAPLYKDMENTTMRY